MKTNIVPFFQKFGKKIHGLLRNKLVKDAKNLYSTIIQY